MQIPLFETPKQLTKKPHHLKPQMDKWKYLFHDFKIFRWKVKYLVNTTDVFSSECHTTQCFQKGFPSIPYSWIILGFFFFCIATQQIPRYTSNFLYFGIINTLGWMILCWECCLCNVGCFKASWLTSPLMPVALPQLWQPESVHTFLNIFWGSKTATIQEHTLLNLLNLHILLNSVPNTPYTRGAITTSLYFITYK